MRVPWLALACLMADNGIGAAIASHRRPAPAPVDPAPATTQLDELAREVRELREAVNRLRWPQPPAPPAPSARIPAPEPAPPATGADAPTPLQREALADANHVVDEARRTGTWTAAHRQRLHQLAASIRPEELIALLQGLSVEINNQKIRPAEPGPLF